MKSDNRLLQTIRIAVIAAVLAAPMAAAACGKPDPAATPTASASASASAPPTSAAATPSASPSTTSKPAVDPALIFAADGIGPYQLGTPLADLQADGLVTDLFDSPICPGVKIGESTGKYAGKLRLAFASDGKLWYIDTDAPDLQTPSGGKIGMTIAQLKAIYGTKGTVIPNGPGQLGGLLVKVAGTSLAIVFLRDNAGKAFSMSAGPADVVESFATGGEGC